MDPVKWNVFDRDCADTGVLGVLEVDIGGGVVHAAGIREDELPPRTRRNRYTPGTQHK